MAEVMKSKWIRNKKADNNTYFFKFKHVSALIVHIFQVVAANAKKITNKAFEIEQIQKFCQFIKIFGLNIVNVVLIDRLKGC